MKEKELFQQVSQKMLVDVQDIEAKYNKNKATQKTKNMRKYQKKIIGAVTAAAACLVVVCMPVMAEGVKSLWDTMVAKQYGADEEIQEKYKDTNLTQTFDDNADAVTVAECNGVTVTLQQTMADDYGMRVYVDVNTNGQLPLTDEHIFDKTIIYVDGEVWDGYTNASGGFVTDEYAVSDTERSYEMFYLNSAGIDLTGKDIRLDFVDLLGDKGKQDFYTAVEGTWSLEWNVSGKYVGEIKTVDLKNTKLDNFIVSDIELSPISYTLNYKYTGKDFGDAIAPHVAFIMDDGTIYDDETNPEAPNDMRITGGGGGESIDQSRMAFIRVLDLDHLKALRINGTVFEVK